jgi:hypothetical protein
MLIAQVLEPAIVETAKFVPLGCGVKVDTGVGDGVGVGAGDAPTLGTGLGVMLGAAVAPGVPFSTLASSQPSGVPRPEESS